MGGKKMSAGATIGHTAVKVKDMNRMIELLKNLLGFRVLRKKGEGAAPASIWFEEGLQLVHDPDFEGPEGRLHHLGILTSNRQALVQECRRRGFSEVRTNWYALPEGLVLEFLEK